MPVQHPEENRINISHLFADNASEMQSYLVGDVTTPVKGIYSFRILQAPLSW